MMNAEQHQQQLATALVRVTLPSGIEIRMWSDGDFPAIQRLSSVEGWTSPTLRPDDSLLAWPALVAVGDLLVTKIGGSHQFVERDGGPDVKRRAFLPIMAGLLVIRLALRRTR